MKHGAVSVLALSQFVSEEVKRLIMTSRSQLSARSE
jgi:hypothetical protein